MDKIYTRQELIEKFKRTNGRETIFSRSISYLEEGNYKIGGEISGLETTRKGSNHQILEEEVKKNYPENKLIWIVGARLRYASQGNRQLLLIRVC